MHQSQKDSFNFMFPKRLSEFAVFFCLVTKTYIFRFSGVFRTKIQRTNTLKVEYAIEMKFLSGKLIQALKIRVILLAFTAGHQFTGFHVLGSMWTTSASMCSSVQVASSSHSSSMLKVPIMYDLIYLVGIVSLVNPALPISPPLSCQSQTNGERSRGSTK